MPRTKKEAGAIKKTQDGDLPGDIGFQELIATMQQKLESVDEKAQALEQIVAALEQARQPPAQAPARAPQPVMGQSRTVHLVAAGLVENLQEKEQALEQMLARLDQVQQRQAPTPDEKKIPDKMSAVNLSAEGLLESLNNLDQKRQTVNEDKIHEKMSAAISVAAALHESLKILEQKRGPCSREQQGFEHSLALTELQTQHQLMTVEAQNWKAKHDEQKAKHDEQVLQTQDLTLRYEEVSRAHESQAARARELEVRHKMLQEQVEQLTQQNVAHMDSIQRLAPVADAAQCREVEFHEALGQARGEVQQWQELHQQAHGSAQNWQAQYEKTMQELQQSQFACQQAKQEADLHRQELLLKEAELVRMNTLNTKVLDLESLVGDKQQEVDRLSQQLRETQAENAVSQQEEVVGGAAFGSVIDEIVELKQELKGSCSSPTSSTVTASPANFSSGSFSFPARAVPARKGGRSVNLPVKETASPRAPPLRAVSSDKGYPFKAPRNKASGSLSPPTLNPPGPSSPKVQSRVLNTPAATSARSIASPQTAYRTVAVEQVNPVTAVSALEAGYRSPKAMSSRVVYSTAAVSPRVARSISSPKVAYPTYAGLQQSAGHMPLSRPGSGALPVGGAAEISRSRKKLAL